MVRVMMWASMLWAGTWQAMGQAALPPLPESPHQSNPVVVQNFYPNNAPAPTAQQGRPRTVAEGPPVIDAIGGSASTLAAYRAGRIVTIRTNKLMLHFSKPVVSPLVLLLDGHEVTLPADLPGIYTANLGKLIPAGVYSFSVAMGSRANPSILGVRTKPITFRYQPENFELVQAHSQFVATQSESGAPPAPSTEAAKEAIRERFLKQIHDACERVKKAKQDLDNARASATEAAKQLVKFHQSIPTLQCELLAAEEALRKAQAAVDNDVKEHERLTKLIEAIVEAASVVPKSVEYLEELKQKIDDRLPGEKLAREVANEKCKALKKSLEDANKTLDGLTSTLQMAVMTVEDLELVVHQEEFWQEKIKQAFNAVFPGDAGAAASPDKNGEGVAPAAATDASSDDLRSRLRDTLRSWFPPTASPSEGAGTASVASIDIPPPTAGSQQGAPTGGPTGDGEGNLANASIQTGRDAFYLMAPDAFGSLAAVQRLKPGEFTNSRPGKPSPLTVYEYRFHSPAHIAWNRFRQRGGAVDRTGVVIFEGMQFAAREDGTYEVAFDAQAPAAPVDLRLQLMFQNVSTERWQTITLPPIRLAAATSQREAAQVHRVVQRGHSSALEMAPLTEDFVMRRSGTATIGFDAGQYRPQVEQEL